MNRKEAADLIRRIAELERLVKELQEQLNARPRQTDRGNRRG